MGKLIYSMGTSLDGYIVGPDGGFDWTVPEEEVFDLSTEEVRGLSAYVLGRRLYETMLYWETVDENPSLGFSTAAFAALWRSLPKIVFSNTLTEVQGSARLASDGLIEEIARLRDEGDIAIGGATLAAEAAELGLIDEYRIRIYPVVVGGGVSFFPQHERRADLELIESRAVGSKVSYLRYRVPRRTP